MLASRHIILAIVIVNTELGVAPCLSKRVILRGRAPVLRLKPLQNQQLPPATHRLAIELSGCLRSLNLTTDARIHGIRHARSAGFAVDLFCVLEACNPMEEQDAQRNVDAFVAQISESLGSDGKVAHCMWYPAAQGVLQPGGNDLKRQYRPPGYPFCHHRYNKAPNTIAYAHKLHQVSVLRQKFSETSGQRYDLVWRQRPDWVSSGLDMELLRKELLPQSDQLAMSARNPRAKYAYVVPQSCSAGAHTDAEAVLTTAAADHYDSLHENIPWLYRAMSGWFPGPEILIDAHMRVNPRGFRYYVQQGWYMFRCSAECFQFTSKDPPCRREPVTRMNTTHGVPGIGYGAAIFNATCGLPNVQKAKGFLAKGPCGPKQTGASVIPIMAIINASSRSVRAMQLELSQLHLPSAW